MAGRIRKVEVVSSDGNTYEGYIYDETPTHYEVLVVDGSFHVVIFDKSTLVDADYTLILPTEHL